MINYFIEKTILIDYLLIITLFSEGIHEKHNELTINQNYFELKLHLFNRIIFFSWLKIG